jgi:hypothetical protein
MHPIIPVQTARPFLNCGVNYAGPFYVSQVIPNEHNSSEMLCCRFYLLAVKVIRVELVSSLISYYEVMPFEGLLLHKELHF